MLSPAWILPGTAQFLQRRILQFPAQQEPAGEGVGGSPFSLHTVAYTPCSGLSLTVSVLQSFILPINKHTNTLRRLLHTLAYGAPGLLGGSLACFSLVFSSAGWEVSAPSALLSRITLSISSLALVSWWLHTFASTFKL